MKSGSVPRMAVPVALGCVLSLLGVYLPGQDVDRFPGFRLPDLSGEMVSFDEFRGKVVLVDLWATWCPPCEKQMPWFEEFQGSFREQGLEVVGIALDSDPETVGRFVTEHGVSYTILLHPDLMEDTAEQEKWGVRGIPTTFILDRQGTVAHKVVGFEKRKVFEEILGRLLP